jgi:hypothetical protein
MKTRLPFSVIILITLMAFQALSVFLGFYMLLLAPNGTPMRIPLSMLEDSPFSSFLVPGLILLVFLCLFPFITLYGLIKLPKWNWCEKLNMYKDKKWPWTFSIYFGIILVCWIIVEEAMIGGGHLLQTIYSSLGVAIIIFTLIPKTIRYYSK